MLGNIMPASRSTQRNVLHKSIKIQSIFLHVGKEHRAAAAWTHIKTVPLKCNCKSTSLQTGGGVFKIREWNPTKKRMGGRRVSTVAQVCLWNRSPNVFGVLAFHLQGNLYIRFTLKATPLTAGMINGRAVDWGKNCNAWLCSLPQGSWSFSRMVTWTSWSTNGGRRMASVTCTPQWTQSRKEVPWT